ncbi:MAG: thiamine/thiamine pyrophosphate ABC transporter permease ThiP [Hyphomicrobiales bacterium]
MAKTLRKTAKPGLKNGSKPLANSPSAESGAHPHIGDVRSFKRFPGALAPGFLVTAFLLGFALLIFGHILLLPQTQATAFFDEKIWRILQFTLFQASLSTLLSIAIGLAIAWGLYHQRAFMGRSWLITLFSSALVLPTLVAVLGLVSVFGRRGWANQLIQSVGGEGFGAIIYGLAGILIAHVYFNASYSARALLNRFETIPAQKLKLARSLGLSFWQRFKFVEWPAVRSTLPGLAATIFLLCFTSFAIVLVLGGSPKYNTLEVAIFEAVKLDFDLGRALGLALTQVFVCALVVAVAANFRATSTNIAREQHAFMWPETPGAQILQWGFIGFGAIGFIAPLAAVILDGLQADFVRLIGERTFQQAAFTSLFLAAISSTLTVLCALAMANARRTLSTPSRISASSLTTFLDRIIAFAGTLYLAIPSLVLGLGFFLIARQSPGSLKFWAVIALITANVLMALPFALAILVPAMEKTALRFDKLCFSLGVRGGARWRLAEWPLLKSDIFYVAALAFCISLGDLGVIALFGSQDFATLPWLLYQKMGSYRTDDAAGIALILLVLILIVFAGLPKLFEGKKNAAP